MKMEQWKITLIKSMKKKSNKSIYNLQYPVSETLKATGAKITAESQTSQLRNVQRPKVLHNI